MKQQSRQNKMHFSTLLGLRAFKVKGKTQAVGSARDSVLEGLS